MPLGCSWGRVHGSVPSAPRHVGQGLAGPRAVDWRSSPAPAVRLAKAESASGCRKRITRLRVRHRASARLRGSGASRRKAAGKAGSSMRISISRRENTAPMGSGVSPAGRSLSTGVVGRGWGVVGEVRDIGRCTAGPAVMRDRQALPYSLRPGCTPSCSSPSRTTNRPPTMTCTMPDEAW